MKPEHISDALSQIDDELIREAAEARSHAIKRRPAWQRWGALAACAAVAVFAGTRLVPTTPAPPSQPPQSTTQAPSPGSQGPSQPVSGELPMITIQDMGAGAMGFEGYLAFDISELGSGANPWNEEAELATLPVYKNPLTYDEMYRVSGANPRRMKALLLDTAQKLGFDTEKTPITDNSPSEDYKKAVTEKMAAVGEEVPEGYFDPTTLIMEENGIKIEVDQTLTARIEFDPPVELPQGYHFAYDATSAQMRKAAAWLLENYWGLLSGMEKPLLDQGMADRNIYEERSFDVEYFDGSGSLEEQIVHYNFNRVAFYNNDEGRLFLARVYAPDLSDKMGDYPIVSVEEAKELLLAGNYATSVPWEMPGEEHIAKVELLYRTSSYEAVWLPYYRFLVYLPEQDLHGMKTYGAYYVPAVEGRYLTNMPTYDGSFYGGGTAVKKPDPLPEEEPEDGQANENFEPAETSEAVPEPTPPMEETDPRIGLIVPGQK